MEAFQFTERILDRLGLDIVISEETEEGEEKRALLLRNGNGLGKVVFMKEGKRVEIGPFRDENAETGLSSYPFVLWDRTLLPILSTLFDTLWGEGEWTIDKRSETSLRLFEDLDVSYGDVRSIERRYEGENMILEMVKSGDVRVVEAFSLAGSSLFSAVEKRNPSALRNIQNYAIIANTLLRKTAEEAGVSPFMVDRISSFYGMKIETVSTSFAIETLFTEMLISYTRLVGEMKHRSFSEPIRRVIFEISMHYSENLSLSYLSSLVSLSPSHLSRLFHRSVGETVVSYIRRIRVENSLRYLGNPDYKISDVAGAVGFQDSSYYSRVFSCLKGESPEEWRRRKWKERAGE